MIFPKNILIVRTDRIGDVILSLPLAALIKKTLPECNITFLLRDYTKSLAYGNPNIDEVLILKEKNGNVLFNENVKMLQQHKFDTSIIVYPTFLTSLIIFFSNIKNRIGSGYRWYSFLFNYKVFEHRKSAAKHELEFNVNMLKVIGIDTNVNKENVKFDIHYDQNKREEIKKYLENKGIDFIKPVVILHPGSGGSAVDLPLKSVSELIYRISSGLNIKVILTGSMSEKDICDKFVSVNQAVSLAGKYDLDGLKALISLSDIFIANSTGPLHIAAAMGKYIIGFYPKIRACSVERWGPYTRKTEIFTPEIDCSDCTREQCVKLNCMSSIDMKKVFTSIEKIFKFIAANKWSSNV